MKTLKPLWIHHCQALFLLEAAANLLNSSKESLFFLPATDADLKALASYCGSFAMQLYQMGAG